MGTLGPTHVAVILHVAIEVVGSLVVYGHVIHLADRQRDAVKAATVHGGDDHSSVICDHKAIGICRINPNVVSVSTPANLLKILTAIQ